MTSNMLMKLEPQNLAELENVAAIFAASGLFSDARQMAQAFVKIMAGRELGFGAFASMNGINIIQGKPAMGANLIAAAIKRHNSPRYDYRVVTLDNEACIINFYQDGELVGTSTFTKTDAQAAKLAGKENWSKNPRNMLFARAISNGARWFCPDVFGGPVYTPDEMGADVDEDGDVLIIEAPQEPPVRPPDNRLPTRAAFDGGAPKGTGMHNGTEPLPKAEEPAWGPADPQGDDGDETVAPPSAPLDTLPADFDTRILAGVGIETFNDWMVASYPDLKGNTAHAAKRVLKALDAKSWSDAVKLNLTLGDTRAKVEAYMAQKETATE